MPIRKLTEAMLSASHPWRLFFAFAALSAVVAVVGSTVYTLVADSIRQRENLQLSAIAEFKKDQIVNWLAERRGDIQGYMDSPFFADALGRIAKKPEADTVKLMTIRLEATRKAHGYVSTELITADGRVVATAGDARRHGPEFQNALRAALERPEPVLLDLHRPDPTEPIRLSYVAAIRDGRQHGRPAVGWVVFTVDPERALYPMLGAWPTSSVSGETFIVRREGDEVVFLSPLRHRRDKPLSLRFPLSRKEIPAVQAVTLGSGIYQGTDYRGEPVLTATRSVSGTPWVLLSKIDQEEVFADVDIVGAICAALILAGIVVIGLVLAMAWRQQRLRDQALLDQRLHGIVSTTPGALVSFRLDGDGNIHIPYVSEGVKDLIGLDVASVCADSSSFFNQMAEGDATCFQQSVAKAALARQSWRFEWRIHHPLKGERWIEGSALPQIQGGGDVFWHGHFHDVTERRTIEAILREQLDLEDRFTKVAASVPGLICSFRRHLDGRTSMPFASPSISELFGLSPEAVAADASAIFARITADDVEAIETSMARSVQAMAPWQGQFRFRHPIKGDRWIEGHTVPKLEADGSVLWHGYVHDITERKQSEISLGRANRMLQARSLSNRALLKATDEPSYLQEVCEIIVDVCDHTMTWIGYVDQGPEKRVLPVSVAGLDLGYLDGATVTGADDQLGQGPVGMAIRTRQAIVCQELLNDPRFALWREEAVSRGYRSCAALPLKAERETLGALTVYSSSPNAFPDYEVRLLADIADDIAHGISVLRLRVSHKRTLEVLERYRLHLEKLVDDRTRQLQEAVRLAEKRAAEVADLYNSAPCGYHSLNSDGLFVGVNDTELSWLGYQRDELVGKMRFSDLLAADEKPRFEDNFARFLIQGYLFDQEYQLRGKNGQFIPVSLSKTMIRDESGAFLMSRSVTFNLTERKRVEEELQRYRDDLESLVAARTAALSEANRELIAARDTAEAASLAKSVFLTNMSHELRTPLTAILGFTQLLELSQDVVASEEYSLCVGHILKNGKLLLALINDLLDLAKIDAGHVATSPERIVLTDLLPALEASLLPLAESMGITVSTHAGDGLPDVRADPTRINQVLLNIGTNAIKYNRPGGRVDIGCERLSPDWIRLTVADTGAGIPDIRQHEVFEPFNRLGREAGSIEGTGIGLALSRRLMHLMGGRIGFNSRPDEGSRFWVDIPVHHPVDARDGAIAPVAPSLAGQAAPQAVDDGVRNRTILCVDDNASARDLVVRIIVGIPGIEVLTAPSAEEGIELALRHSPDLILMDINLPGMDGIAALAELRRHCGTKAIPVFALSAAATVADIEKGRAAGFDRYLTKPYDVQDLLTTLKDKLANGGNRTERAANACDKELVA